MSDKLVVDIDSKDAEVAMRNLDRLTAAAEQMGKAFENTKGATSALRELRLMLTGIKGQQSSLDQLTDSIKNMNSSSESLKRSIVGSIKNLGTIIKSEMEQVRAVMFTSGISTGKALAEGIDDSTSIATGAVKRQGRTLAAAAKAEATRVYEAMVAGQANAKIKDPSALFQLQQAGATLSPYHKQVLANWKDSQKQMLKALKKQLDEGEAETQQMLAAQAAQASQLSAGSNGAAAAAAGRARAEGYTNAFGVYISKGVQDAEAAALARLSAGSSGVAAAAAGRARAEGYTNAFGVYISKGVQDAEAAAFAKLSAGAGGVAAAAAARQRAEGYTNAFGVYISKGVQDQISKAEASAARALSAGAGGVAAAAPVRPRAVGPTNALGLIGPQADGDLPKRTREVDSLSKALKQLTIDGNDAHSMARGLASGFNLLWLTWGNLVPLFAGASVSFGLKKTFDIGSEVEYQIKMMETLGQTTQSQGKVIREALREIDQTTQFSLVELSQAMVRLGQSGKTPKEALEILRHAADLASVGMVDLKTSTDLLIQTQALFGKSTADVGKIAAQVFEITKSGVLNVEDIGASMKYASEVNTRFGKSLEETLTILGALAQAGLKGPLGGTAYINFLRDINGRSGPAVAALKELEKATGRTIEVFKKSGEQRSAIEIFTDIAAAADKLKAKDADKLLAKILSDRGGRAFFAMIRDGRIELQKTADSLKNMDPNALFMAAKGLMDATKGALNVLQGALVGTLDKVFEANETKFKTFIIDITAAIGSPAFGAAVHSMVSAVGSLYESIKTLMPVLQTLGTAWVVFKAASIGVSVFQGLAVAIAGMAPVLGMTGTAIMRNTAALATSTQAWSANGVAMIGNVAASRAAAAGIDSVGVAAARSAATAAVAGTGMRALAVVLGFLSNPIVGIITTLGLLGAAFWSAKSDAEAATAGMTGSVVKNGSINLAQWDAEIKKLRERNALMKDGFTPLDEELSEARKAQAQLENEIKVQREKVNKFGGKAFTFAQAQEILKLNQLVDRQLEGQRKINDKALELSRIRAEERNKEIDADLKRRRGITAQGTLKVPAPTDGFGRPESVPFDNQMQQIEKQYAINLKADATQAANQQKILAAKHSAMLISEGQYQAELFKITTLSETKQLQIIDDASAEFEKAYKERAAVLLAAKKTDDLKNLEATKKTFTEKTGADKDAIADKRATDIEVAAIKATEAVNKLAVANTEYWAKIEDNKQALTAISDIEAKYAQVTATSSVALQATKEGELAAVAATQQHAEKLRAVQNEATKSVQLYAALVQAKEDYAATPDANPVNLALFDAAIAQVKATTTTVISELDKTATKVGQSSSEAFALSFKGTAQRIFDSLSSLDFAAGFDDATKALSGLLQGMDKLILAQEAYKVSREAAVKLGEKGANEVARLDAQNAKNQIRNYGQMAESAKGFFKEGSRDYKVLDSISKAFYAAELARAVFNTGEKLALMATEVVSAGVAEANKTAISNTGEAARMPAKIAGIYASFMSMMGPWGIPAAIAAIAAAGLSAYGKSNSNTLAPTNEGKGTVFGDKEAKSESVGKTIQLLESISKFGGIENSYSAKMLASLRSIENSMGGVTNLVLRSNGMENVAAKVQQGYSGNGVTKAISGAGTVMTVAKLATGALGPLGFISDMLLGKFLAPIINKLFGTKTKVTGQGLYAADTTLDQVRAVGLEAGYYVDINKKKKAFGITYSNKNSTNFTKDDEISRQFSLILNGFVDSVKLAAPVLGFTLDQIDTNLKDFVVKIGRVNLKDLSGAEVQEKLAAVFGAVGDDIAKAAIPGLERFQKVGEGYFETLARVASNLSSVNQMFDTLGVKLFDASIAGAEASIKFAELFGGLENMTSVVGDYYETFYTEEERMAKLQEQLTREFAALGKEMPASKAAFREMVEGLLNNASYASYGAQKTSDILSASMSMFDRIGKGDSLKDAASSMLDAFADTGEGGMELAAKLLQLAPAFAQVSDYAEAVNETLRSSLIDLESGFAGGGFSRQYRAEDAANTVSGLLADVGIQKDAGMLAQQMLSATSGEVETYFREIWNVLETDEARQKLVDVTGVMMDLAQSAADAAQSLEKLANSMAQLATSASSARDLAGSAMDKLAGAAGFQGDGYARIREARLWDQMLTAPWEQQIELASELTNIVVSRYETEKQAAKEQLEFAKSLRDYVNSLMTGDLSPLTNAEKLSKAQDTYLKTLAAARGGDTDAQGKLQGASSEYLELARNYYASSETYTAIFESVTGALSSLGKAVEVANSDKIGSETLAQMYKLYGVLDSGYQTANAEALKQTSLLVEQLTQLSKVSGGVAKVIEIIAGLPVGTSSQVGNSVLGNIAQEYAGLMGQVGVSTSVADTVTAINNGSTADLKASYEWSKGIMQTDSQRAALEAIWSAVSQYRSIDGSHADGLAYVPFDGYTAELHKGERVLTAYENRNYSATPQDYDAVVEELQGLREDYARLTAILAEVISNSAAASAEKIVKGTGAAVEKATYDNAVKAKATVR